jgi:hypothetical protein
VVLWGQYSVYVVITRRLTAMGIMVYALYTYHWRAASIRRGGRGPYDDRLGPVRALFFHLFYIFLAQLHLPCISPADCPLHFPPRRYRRQLRSPVYILMRFLASFCYLVSRILYMIQNHHGRTKRTRCMHAGYLKPSNAPIYDTILVYTRVPDMQ